jgi:hypothetical protein
LNISYRLGISIYAATNFQKEKRKQSKVLSKAKKVDGYSTNHKTTLVAFYQKKI